MVCSPALGLVCTAATPVAVSDPATNSYATDHVLLVGHIVSCTGSFNFTQAVFESVSGVTQDFNITLPAVAGWDYTKSGGTPTDPKTLTVSVSITRSFTVQIGTCTLPLNATSRYLQQVVVVQTSQSCRHAPSQPSPSAMAC